MKNNEEVTPNGEEETKRGDIITPDDKEGAPKDEENEGGSPSSDVFYEGATPGDFRKTQDTMMNVR